MEAERKPFHEIVAEKLIEQLKQGTAPWQKPWEPGEAGANMPFNPTTGKRFKGINALHLMSEGREDQRWMTYKQAEAANAQVRRGEKGTPIQYWKFSEEQNKTDLTGKPILNSTGDPVKETVELERPRLFFATVFNAEQIDGLPPLQPRWKQSWNTFDRAEQILRASGATIRHGEHDRAFYRPSSDSIHLPEKDHFPTADNYYATALHELGHWTGHATRLARDLVHPFGSEGYAKEELRAEIASMILGDELGVGHDSEQHAAYVGSWIRALENDPLEIFRAAADAEKIQEYVMGLEQKQVQEQIPEAAMRRDASAQVQTDLESLSRLSIAEQITAGTKMTEKAVANPGYKLALQAELNKCSGEILVSGAELKRRMEAPSTDDAKPAHPYAEGFSAAQMALNRADQILERQAQLAAAPRGYVLRFYDDEGRHDEPQPDLAAAIIAFDKRGNFSKVMLDGEEIIGAEADPGYEVLIFDREIKQVYERVLTLNVDLAATLGNPEDSFGHFETFQGAGLVETLRAHGLSTVHDVTGNDPARFFETASASLSPVFGIAPDHTRMDSAYMERKELTQVFSGIAAQLLMPHQRRTMAAGLAAALTAAGLAGGDSAEAWTPLHLGMNALARALDGAGQVLLARVGAVLTAMSPLSSDNPFWQRNELPLNVSALADRIEAAKDLLTVRQADAIVATSRRKLVLGQAHGRERADDGLALDRVAEANLGFPLPHDWTGRVYIQGNFERDNDSEIHVLPATHNDEEPESWGIYVQVGDGTYKHLVHRSTKLEADQLAERLAVIDARSTINEYDKAVKLARVNEERVCRNPDRTDEDISAARDSRKSAEFAATTNDADLQRRIEFEERQRTLQAVPAENVPPNLIAVPYKEKDEAKALGAKWNRKEQSWYVPQNVDPAPFGKWAYQPTKAAASESQALGATAGKAVVSKAAEGREYLAVPYGDRTQAKAAGAKWDKAAKSWYVDSNADKARLKKWKPENVSLQQSPAMTPRDEFADALRSIGCMVPAGSKHPIMDGATHRVSVEGETFSENSGAGFYVGHLDGHPAGYMKNNRTGTDLTWKAKGYTLAPEQKALMAAQAAEKLQQREAEQSKQHEQAAKRVDKELGKLVPVTKATPYMQAKGIVPHAGALTDKDGKVTYLPATDVHGKHWTTQYIKEDGTKRFAKNSKKDGCFHVVGGIDGLAKAPVIVISEGYATAAQLQQSLGFATVSAFDSGNLASVAQALHRKFPDKPVVIAGDDDRHLEMTQGVNPGRSKAEKAANLVGGKLMMPTFAPGENSYPPDLNPVTPEQYREHQHTGEVLTAEQLRALAQMKQFTDFNDLANKSVLGSEGLDRQVRSLVESVLGKRDTSRFKQQQQGQHHDPTPEPKMGRTEEIQAPKRRRAAKIGS